MSSQLSQRRTPSPTEHVEALKLALIEVAQETFFSYAEACAPERFAEALDTVPADPATGAARWLSARVEFAGAFAGRVTVALPYGLAADMASALAGITPDEGLSETDVVDATGEFANMVCGTWLTRACARRRFDLQPPAVGRAAPQARTAGPDDELILVNDQPLRLTVEFMAA
jgi:hypothetical protein